MVKVISNKSVTVESISSKNILKAIEFNNVSYVKDYIAENLDKIDEAVTKFGNTLLLFSAFYGHENLVTLLLENGANPEVKNREGQTALMIAELYNKKKVVEVLTKYKQQNKGKVK